MPAERIRAEFETNVCAPPALCRLVLPGMSAQGSGKIVNVSSTALPEASVRVYERGFLARLGGPPEAVAERIEDALQADRPRARYTVTPSARVLLTLRPLLPDAGWDRMLRSSFPSPGED